MISVSRLNWDKRSDDIGLVRTRKEEGLHSHMLLIIADSIMTVLACRFTLRLRRIYLPDAIITSIHDADSGMSIHFAVRGRDEGDDEIIVIPGGPQ